MRGPAVRRPLGTGDGSAERLRRRGHNGRRQRVALRADRAAWSYEGFKTACGRELDKPEMALFREKRWVFHGLRKNAVNMLLEVGCSEEQVAAIVGMSAAMVHHYAKEVSKFRLARSAMKILENGWESQRIHVLGNRKKPG